jgi:hypothetical protein
MLLDRVCPGGGWNAGNSVVYGRALAPHPDDTAVALLALKDRSDEPAVRRSLAWLEDYTSTISSPWSLAWSALALAAHSRCIRRLLSALAEHVRPSGIQDNATLAVLGLAFDSERALLLLTS